jgi:hypothetical protein
LHSIRYANFFALLAVLVLAVLATRMTPMCIEMILGRAGEAEQRRLLRKSCRDALERHRALYGELPVEEWPSERAKQIHANAKRILAELEETEP